MCSHPIRVSLRVLRLSIGSRTCLLRCIPSTWPAPAATRLWRPTVAGRFGRRMRKSLGQCRAFAETTWLSFFSTRWFLLWPGSGEPRFACIGRDPHRFPRGAEAVQQVIYDLGKPASTCPKLGDGAPLLVVRFNGDPPQKWLVDSSITGHESPPQWRTPGLETEREREREKSKQERKTERILPLCWKSTAVLACDGVTFAQVVYNGSEQQLMGLPAPWLGMPLDDHPHLPEGPLQINMEPPQKVCGSVIGLYPRDIRPGTPLHASKAASLVKSPWVIRR